MRVLAIMSHPDDIEIYCSGTLIKCAQRGDEVFACHVSDGNMGHMVIMPDELAEIRIKEAENAGKVAGYEVLSCHQNDLLINASDQNQIDEVIKVIRYAKPDLIITHAPEDYCSDHAEVSKLVFNASFSASCPHFKPELGEACGVAAIYYAETSEGLDFIPTEYVDISDVADLKTKAILCHESQVVWLKEHDNIDLPKLGERISKFRGGQCGVDQAEGFRPCVRSGRIKPYRMLP